MSSDSFWAVQKIWIRAKNSPLDLEKPTNGRPSSESLRGPNDASLSEEAGDMSERLLKLLASRGSFDSYKLSQELGVDHQQVVGAIKSVQSVGDLIQTEQQQFEMWVLTTEGTEVMQTGSHEARLFNAIDKEKGSLQSEIMSSVANAKIGFSKAMSLGWLRMDKQAAEGPRIFQKVPSIVDGVQETLRKLSSAGPEGISAEQFKDFKKRKLISNLVIKSFLVSQGSDFTTEMTKQEADLTPEMIQSGLWKSKSFKAYNFDALGVPPTRGHLHPLMKVRTEIRQIFLEMGFSEMPTNNFIESSFWNFDALFQPQQHPARDAHDTFFIKDPPTASDFPMDYLNRVKTMHESGGHGSVGYKYSWKLEEARKNLLRTHTTAVSARMLYQLGQQQHFQPVKYFSIDRVFRNESLDATHLAEFHQIEGSVADYDLTLGDLMGMLHEFFSKMGIKKLRFKPAYNPYTEPSMEVFSYHEGLKKWVEVGNSGVFRPEMLLPMGLPPNVSVIAWGLSLERPTMIKYGISNIRELVGHKVNLEMVQNNPLCRL